METLVPGATPATEKLVTDPVVNPLESLSTTSTSLLRRVQTGEQEAWERLVSLYHPLIYGWCRRAGLQEADAVDVGQEVFRAVARSIENFHRDRPGDTFRGWLRRITQNKVRDHMHQRRSEVIGVGGDDTLEAFAQIPAEADDSADTSGEINLVYRRAVELIGSEFEERSRQAFFRVVLENERPEEVAQALGMTVNAVYLAKSRILTRLREEFADLME